MNIHNTSFKADYAPKPYKRQNRRRKLFSAAERGLLALFSAFLTIGFLLGLLVLYVGGTV